MQTVVTRNGNEVTILVKGSIDTSSKSEAEAVFVGEAKKHDSVILNMSGVTYISSAGIRVLRMLYMTMYKKGGKLKMIEIPESVMEVLKMTGVDDMIEL